MNGDNGFWEGKIVLVTGGCGFLGSYVVDRLLQKRCRVIAPSHSEYDLTKEGDVKKLFSDNPRVDIIIHMAVNGGGIGYLKEKPGSSFYNNMMMALLLLEQARLNGVKKFVGIGSICEYPKFTPTPFREEDLWNGFPEETNAPYGIAKRGMLIQSQGYRDQYGFNAIHLMPVNLYGPGDDFDLKSSHVISALIKKIVVAKETNAPYVEIWGTGNASREFLYVDDCAEAIILATEKYNGREPINLGSGKEIRIRDLVTAIKSIIRYEGKIKWDTTKPDGQPRRHLDISKAKIEFGFKAKTSLDDGLRKTSDWYIKNRK